MSVNKILPVSLCNNMPLLQSRNVLWFSGYREYCKDSPGKWSWCNHEKSQTPVSHSHGAEYESAAYPTDCSRRVWTPAFFCFCEYTVAVMNESIMYCGLSGWLVKWYFNWITMPFRPALSFPESIATISHQLAWKGNSSIQFFKWGSWQIWIICYQQRWGFFSQSYRNCFTGWSPRQTVKTKKRQTL